MSRYRCQYAWVGSEVLRDVVIAVEDDRILSVTPAGDDLAGDDLAGDDLAGGNLAGDDLAGEAPEEAVALAGLTLPGIANAHSHAFHRALRGVTGGPGSFWTWQQDMYAVAARLDPDNYYRLARAVYAEMALAGVVAVGEFHYVHHGPGGVPYDDPNAMSAALVAAAQEAGIRITLLDTLYLRGGFDLDLAGPQLRFGDASVDAWAARVEAFQAQHGLVGAAIHSVRAVEGDSAARAAEWSRGRGMPLHFHLSEQVAENEACLEATGRTPTELLDGAGVLGAGSTAVHATHLAPGDIGLLGSSSTTICVCPTTERDLGDGVGQASRLVAAGSPLALGSDSQAVIDPFVEARLLELHERFASQQRGHYEVAELLEAATRSGMRALSWESGEIAAGRPADLVTVRLDSVRTAGISDVAAAVVYAATAADVTDVMVGGRPVVTAGQHLLGDVPRMLDAAVAALRD